MHKRTAALMITSALVSGTAGALLVTPASAATSSNPVTSRLAHFKSALAGLVSDGTLTQAQADKVAATLDKELPKHRPGGPGHGPRGHLRHLELATAAKTLGMTEQALRTQLESGKSLADVAKAQNVSVDTLINALVDAAKAQLATAVKDGRITQAEADRIGANLKARITEHVNHTRPARGPWGPPRDGGPGAEGMPMGANA